jgi:N-formylglutamate amidohydrolase
VNANFTRQQIDANRPRADAYEDARATPIYDRYHNTMRQYVDEIKNRFGNKAILIDIHGQGKEGHPLTIFRGTRDRTTVARLINRNGEAAFTGPNSILGILEQKGHKIYPLNSEQRTPEERIYSGGFIVGNYGSNNANGIDAIQLENGWELRNDRHIPNRVRFARDLAEAIVGFYNNYLR